MPVTKRSKRSTSTTKTTHRSGQGEQSTLFDYQQETPNEVQQAVQSTEQSITASADELNAAKERAAFETYVQESETSKSGAGY